MASVGIIVVWILATLVIVSVAAVLGKKYGVEFLIGTMAGLIITANILAAKIVQFGPFTVAGGLIAFSVSFLVTDLISEHWGREEAQKAVWVGLFAQIIYIISALITVSWDAAPFALEIGGMFDQVIGLTPRIAMASVLTFAVSQSHDVWAFHFWKKMTSGKYMWLRNNASTIVSQLIDTTMFTVLAFYGVFPTSELPMVIFGGWVAKVVIAALDTPFMYFAIWLMKKIPNTYKA